MTLTFELDLDILPLDLHAEIQVGMSVRLAVREVTHTQTHTHTDRQTMSKLLHPLLTRGVMIGLRRGVFSKRMRFFFSKWNSPTFELTQKI